MTMTRKPNRYAPPGSRSAAWAALVLLLLPGAAACNRLLSIESPTHRRGDGGADLGNTPALVPNADASEDHAGDQAGSLQDDAHADGTSVDLDATDPDPGDAPADAGSPDDSPPDSDNDAEGGSDSDGPGDGHGDGDVGPEVLDGGQSDTPPPRKRWLVFQANQEQMESYQLYAINTAHLDTRIKVSTNIPSENGTVVGWPKFQFSPDGRYLAYLGTIAGVTQLYVVDMSGESPETPRQVSELGIVDYFAWSPDSHSLAFTLMRTDLQDAIEVLVADVTLPGSHPVSVSAPSSGFDLDIGFVSNDVLTYWLDTLAYLRRPVGQAFAAATLLTSIGELVQRWPDLESGLFSTHHEGCGDPTWTFSLIDFREPVTIREMVGFVSVAPDRRHLAHRDSTDLKYRIYETWGTEPVAVFPTETRVCALGSWSHDGSLFAAAGDNGTVQAARIFQPNGSVTTRVPGFYGYLAQGIPPVFSPDDRWLAFSTDLGAYVSRNDPGSIQPPLGEGVAPSVAFAEPRLSFAPDSTYLATGEGDSVGRRARVTAIDLTQTPPTVNQLEVGLPIGGSAVFDIGWSPDSAELALLVRDAPYPSATNLYVFPRASLRPDFQGDANVTGYTALESVMSFEFQP